MIAFEMKVKGTNVLRGRTRRSTSSGPSRGLPGIPFLAPWANRLDEQAFYAERQAVRVRHGARQRERRPSHSRFSDRTDQWQVVEPKADGKSAWVTSRLDRLKQPVWMKQFPFAHTIEMTHRLQDGALEMLTKSRTHAAEPMPVSIGFHPYYQLTDSPRDEWTVAIPARTWWMLDYRKVADRRNRADRADLPGRQGRAKDYNLDDVFSDLVRDAQGRATPC